jgi:hypothetical protein
VQIPGLVNVDFADVKAIMSNSGTAMLGVGFSTGKNRAEEAALAATSAPLIERSIERATGIVYNITGGTDLTLQEVNEVSKVRSLPPFWASISYLILVFLCFVCWVVPGKSVSVHLTRSSFPRCCESSSIFYERFFLFDFDTWITVCW